MFTMQLKACCVEIVINLIDLIMTDLCWCVGIFMRLIMCIRDIVHKLRRPKQQFLCRSERAEKTVFRMYIHLHDQ